MKCVHLYVKFVFKTLFNYESLNGYQREKEKGEIYVIWCFNLRFEFTDNTETWKLLDTKT